MVLLLLLESSIRAFSLDLKYSRNLNLESSVNDVLEFYGAFFVIFECVRVHFISPSIFEQKLYEGDSFVIVFFFLSQVWSLKFWAIVESQKKTNAFLSFFSDNTK